MRTLSSINLNDSQKRVMAKIAAAPTPKVAAQQISRSQKFIAARDMLVNIGLVDFDPSHATLTDKGQQAMKDEALMDDGGQLTPDGEELAHTDDQGNPEQNTGEQPQTTSDVTGAPTGAPPGGDMGGLGGPPGGQMGAPGGGMGGDSLGLGLPENYHRFTILKDLMETMHCAMAKSRTARTGTMKSAYTKGRYLRRKGHQR